MLPLIACDDYDDFRRDVGYALPENYAEWADIFATQVEEARFQGKAVVLAPINYDEFKSNSRAKGINRDHTNLIAFAETKRLIANA